MLSQFQIIWSLMRGQRLRYACALGCLVFVTVLNYGVPLVGSATIDYAVAGKTAGPGTPFLITALLRFLGGADHLRAHLWLAPAAMVLFAASAGLFSYA